MPEDLDERKIFSLLEVNRSIQRTLQKRYTSAFWVRAEMNKLNYFPQSGHCYPDLLEKADGKVVAQIRANFWKDDYQRVSKKFLELLKEPLKDGIKILFSAKISFDPVHGLTLRILDIDPAYSLGEIEKEKLETIIRLKNERIFSRNKELPVPLLTRRIAVISVQTSKGYQDFTGKIEQNPWGYRFFHMLFPAVLQGEKIVGSITKQLKRIEKVKDHFDVVAIIRGGGGEIGLSSYNDYALAREVALFPLPVFTGIGHITNETVIEMVSCKNLITPTDLADFLLQNFHNFSVPLREATELLCDLPLRIIKEEKEAQLELVQRIKASAMSAIAEAGGQISRSGMSLRKDTSYQLAQARFQTREKGRTLINISQSLLQARRVNTGIVAEAVVQNLNRLFLVKNTGLDHMEKLIDNMNPENVLRRGYSITLLRGKAIKSTDQVTTGETIETMVSDGIITGKVTGIKKNHHHD